MRLFFCALFLGGAILLPWETLAAGVVINEILFDPVGTDTGLEWVEIYNSGNTPQDLSGWELYPDGIGYFLFPQGFTIAPKSFVVVYLRVGGTNSPTALYHSSATQNMGNTSGSAALFSSTLRSKDTIKSFVQWGREGETWESAAADAGLWTKATFVDLSSFSEGGSVALKEDGNATGGNQSWAVVASPTLLTSNNRVLPPPSPNNSVAPPPPLPPPSPRASPPPPPLNISAHAGEDMVAVAGARVEFVGRANGLNGEPLETARFWWNFGDGVSWEGHVASHIFSIPGSYTVGLHVSSGNYAASDYLVVAIVSNQLSVTDVVKGEDGFVRLANPGAYEIDIGGFLLEDSGGYRFVFPPKTKIGAKSEIAISNSLSGLLRNTTSSRATLRYPNGNVAFEWKEAVFSQPLPLVSPVQEAVLLPAKPQKKEKQEPLSPHAKDEEAVREGTTSRVLQGAAAEVVSPPPAFPWFFAIAVVLSVLSSVGFLLIKMFFPPKPE